MNKKRPLLILLSLSNVFLLTACPINFFGNSSKKNSQESTLNNSSFSEFDSQVSDSRTHDSGSNIVNGSSSNSNILLSNNIISYVTDISGYMAYFRSKSFGDFDYSKKEFKDADPYDADLISDGSISPLFYTADLIKNLNEIGLGFSDFTDYRVSFLKDDEYPVPDCELSNNASTTSDSYYVNSFNKNEVFTTKAVYCPATNETISTLSEASSILRKNDAIKRDERAYQKYAEEHYTNIPQQYETAIDDIIGNNGWVNEDYSQVNSIANYISSMGSLSLFNDNEIDFNYKKNSDPVLGLIENRSGNDFDFNTVAVMVFRRLNIPARMVKGYLSVSTNSGENVITLLNQHYYCEIYVKNVGWMICDCMNFEDIFGTNPYGDLEKENGPLNDRP